MQAGGQGHDDAHAHADQGALEKHQKDVVKQAGSAAARGVEQQADEHQCLCTECVTDFWKK